MQSLRAPLSLAGFLLLAITSCKTPSDDKPKPAPSASTPTAAPLVRDPKKIVRDPFPTRGLVYGLAYTADNKRLVSASSADVRLFDAATGELLGLVGTVQSSAARSAVSADGKLAAITFNDKITVLDVDTKATKRSVPLPPKVTGLAIAPNGTVAVGDAEGTLEVFVEGDATGKTTSGTGPRTHLVFDRAGKYIASVLGKEVELVEVATNQNVRSLSSNGEAILGVTFSADGARLAYASKQGNVTQVLVADGKAVGTTNMRESGACALAFSPDGRHVGVGQCDRARAGFSSFFTDESMKAEWSTRAFATQVPLATYAPSGDEIALYAEAIVILSAKNGDQLVPASGHAAPIKHLAFTRDASAYVTASDDGTLRLVDARTNAEKRKLDTKLPVRALALGAGNVVLAAVDDKVLRWDAASGAEQEPFAKHKAPVQSLATSADGKIAASTEKSDIYRMRVWKTDTNEEVRDLKLDALGHTTNATIPCAVSPDGKTAIAVVPASAVVAWDASGAPKGNSALLVFNVATGRGEAPWRMPKWVTSVAFSSSGKEVAVAGVDGVTVYAWPAKTVISTPSKTFVSSVTFTADGGNVLGIEMQKPTLWDAKTGAVRWSAKDVGTAVIAPDGRSLATFQGRGVEIAPVEIADH